MKKPIEHVIIWTALIIILSILFTTFGNDVGVGNDVRLSYSDFWHYVEDGRVEKIVIRGGDSREVRGKLNSGENFVSNVILTESLLNSLKDNNVSVNIVTSGGLWNFLGGVLVSWFPMLLLIAVWVFFMRQVQVGGGKAMSFGRSKARLSKNKKKVTFADVAGIDEAKEDVKEIIDFLKDPKKFKALGGKIPKGCLLVGPPGTGKTLLARAVAGEADVPFFSISGSDFVEMFVGVGASRVRDMFEQGKKNAPCIIFIDEIDAVGRHRGIGLGGGNDEREQTLNQLLVEMDGFEENLGVIIISATNRPDVLDTALLRPGRFDRQVVVGLPDIKGREAILKVHTCAVKLGPDVDVSVVARGTPGFSGADLANLVNEAALFAARMDKKLVTKQDFEYARDKVMMGSERKSLIIKDDEKKLTAYHEAGHAIVSIKMPASDPIHKATIIPRGMALGLVMRLPESDRVSMPRDKMTSDLAVAMGGRVAEEIVFGHDKITSGASSDIKQATDLARSMVMEWGLNNKIGMVYHDKNKPDSISDNMSDIIDEEVKILIEGSYDLAKKTLLENRKKLDKLAEMLLKHETLTGDEIKDLMDGKRIRIEDEEKDGGGEGSSLL